MPRVLLVAPALALVLACSDDGARVTAGSADGGAAGATTPASEAGDFGRGFLYGSPGVDGATVVRVATDGSVYVAGGTNGGLGDEPLGGAADAFVSRIQPNGKIAWTRTIYGVLQEGATGLAVHPDGGVIVTTGSGGRSTTIGSVVRLGRDGRTLFTQTLDTFTPLSAVVDPRGHVFVVGYTNRYTTTPNPLFGRGPEPAVLGSTDGAVVELAADGTPLRAKLIHWRITDQPANTNLYAYNTFPEDISILPGTRIAFVSGVQQDTAGSGLASGWVRRIDLDTLDTTWLRFFNTEGVGPDVDDKYKPTTRPSALYESCLDSAGHLRVAWAQLGGPGLSALTSSLDADGVERSRTAFAPLVPDLPSQSSVAIACAPASEEVTLVVGLGATINREVSFQGVLLRLDGAGKVLGQHRPEVVPYAGLSSANAKIMSAHYGAAGVFFAGEGAGVFEGVSGVQTTSAGALNPDVLVGRVELGF